MNSLEGDATSLVSRSPTESNEESKTGQFTAVNNTNTTAPTASSVPASNSSISNGAATIQSVFGGPSSVPRALPSPLVAPPPRRDSNHTLSGASQSSTSPQHTQPIPQQDDPWQQRPRASSVEPGTAQKRKRSPEDVKHTHGQRAVTPTTQTQHHHLAAHEAAMMSASDPHPPIPFHTVLRQDRDDSMERETDHYSHDDQMRMLHDGGRDGTQEGSPGPGGIQVDPKRRKRVFSNRTKTGCITCRRRKKKCDEGKPECSNCKRGGFVCEGYSGKVSWQKPPGRSGSTTVGTPVTIQSKPDQQPGSTSASPTPVHARPVSSMAQTPQPTAHRGADDRPYGVNTRPEDTSKAASDDSLSPNSAHRQLPPSAYTNQAQSTPLHTEQYTSVQHGSAPNIPQTISTPSSGRRVSFSQAALSAASGSIPRPRSEKEKMINSELYHANAPELVEERKACKAACWRYNNAASNPNLGISDVEKGRLLQEVLRPGRSWEAVPTAANTSGGNGHMYVSEGGYPSDIVDVVVDAPFTCSYGYNIRLGKNVYIEFGCTILDSCAVTIKARTILSPNVSIYSATHPIDPRKRNGSQGPEMAKPVLIEEDCWLGGNVIVLGGITIGKGSVVGAGSVVTRDVPPFTVVAGNPARVIRGIYQNGVDM